MFKLLKRCPKKSVKFTVRERTFYHPKYLLKVLRQRGHGLYKTSDVPTIKLACLCK